LNHQNKLMPIFTEQVELVELEKVVFA